MCIPRIDPKAVGTYATTIHEEMHFIDALLTAKSNKDGLPTKMFSQGYKPLADAFNAVDKPVIGEKARKLFDDFDKEHDTIRERLQKKYNDTMEDLKEQYKASKITWKECEKLAKKAYKEVSEQFDKECRAILGGGITGLQDIYDAISKGTFRDTGAVKCGHGSSYYQDCRRTNPNCSESLANYASLIGHPELIEVLAEDYPEIVTQLRACVYAMLKEVP